jgi:general secretion pathway protein K
MTPPRAERGAALLTVLMLVSVIGVIAAASLERLKLQTHLSGNMAAIDQARQYALAGEAIARTRISDVSSTDRTTTLAGDWLDRPNAFPIDNGTATAKLSDAGNCFNLNSLVSQSDEGERVVRPVAVRQFEALMTLIGVQPRIAGEIAQSAADWIDSDTIPQPGGAEDETYARAPTPYRAANALMADVSELKALAGMDSAIYDRVKPWVCALPVPELSPININTLRRDQAPLVVMLLPDKLSLAFAQRMIDERPATGYSAVENFWSKPALRGISPPVEVMAQTKIKTRWFALEMQIETGGAELTELALIDGGVNPAKIVRRSWGDGA